MAVKTDIIIGIGIILLIVVLVMFRGYIFSDGLAASGDITVEIGSKRYTFYLWNPLSQGGSIANHKLLSWLSFLKLGSEEGQRLFITLPYIIAGSSMFYTMYNILPSEYNRFTRLSVSIFAATFYMINPYSAIRLYHIIMVYLYALIPLIFYIIYNTINKFNVLEYRIVVKNAIITAILLFSSTISFRLPFILLLIISILIITFKDLVYNLRKTIIYIGVAITIFIGLSSIWLLPMTIPYGGVATPTHYALTDGVLRMLSGNAQVINQLTLDAHWNIRTQTNMQIKEPILNTIREAILFSVPLLAFSSLLLYPKNKVVILLSLSAIISIFFAKGTHEPFSEFYEWFVFDSPLSSFGWMFRGVTKWSFLAVMPVITMLTAFTIGWILHFMEKNKKVIPFILILIFMIPAFSGWPLVTGNKFTDALITVPENYQKLNNWLESNTDGKVLWYPSKPDWGSTELSRLPSFGNREWLMYWRLITNDPDILPKDFIKYLSMWDIEHVIVRYDSLRDEQKVWIEKVIEGSNLTLVKRFGDISVYRVNWDNKIVRTYNYAIFTDDIKVMLDILNTTSKIPVILDNYKAPIIAYAFNDKFSFIYPHISKHITIPVAQDFHKGTPSEGWSIGFTHDPLHGEFHQFLPKNVTNWQTDYGKGLIFTWQNITFPKNLESSKEDVIKSWDFSIKEDYKEWMETTREKPFYRYISNDGAFGFEYTRSDKIWQTINSPLVPIKGDHFYSIVFDIKGENVYKGHVSIREYDSNKQFIHEERVKGIGFNGDFDFKTIKFMYKPSSNASYIQLLLWHGAKIPERLLPSKLWMDDVKVYDITKYREYPKRVIDFNLEKGGEYKMFIRYLKNERGGLLNITIDDTNISLYTKDNMNKFIWEDLGNYTFNKGEHKIVIENIEGFNAVNLITFVPIEEYYNILSNLDNKYNNTYTLATNGEIYFGTDINIIRLANLKTIDDNPRADIINYTRIDPTHYKVYINAKDRYILAFSEAYNPLWIAYVNTSDGVKRYNPYPLYSLINGYTIDEVGEYSIDIVYEPQRWFVIGSIITISILITSVLILFILSPKNSIIGFTSKITRMVSK